MSEFDVGVMYPPPPDHCVSVVYKFEIGNTGPKLSINVMPKFHGVIPGLSREGWLEVMSMLETKWPEMEQLAQKQREKQP